MSQVIGKKRGSVVATYFVLARAERSRAVVITYDDVGVGSESALEIRPHGSDENQEEVFFCGVHTHLS